ncbi:G-type lectin S-receptor-like serine/threonine-protein kinase At2g19130 [Bidens hawaiensis]|uniref:G-type lectin S-receptor-like serine/threonine-protein kinase At2g19130 n=1 Tax=Bidens hawaiensis TaxID=980011 RepID=UPI00404A2997
MEFLLLLCFSLMISFASGADTVFANQSLSGNQKIIPKGGNFDLGFFKPGNSSKYYIGIWYETVKTPTIVWVANRETPISDRFLSELKIVNGNLVLLNESKVPIWSTNVTITSFNAVVAVLLDDGNLVLKDGSKPAVEPIWQSFDHPVNIPGYPGLNLLMIIEQKGVNFLLHGEAMKIPV